MEKSRYNKELLIIIVAWILVFAYDPLYAYYAHVAGQFNFAWHKIFEMWGYSAAFLVLFLIHHYILIPRFLSNKKTSEYVTCIILCIMVFTAFLIWNAPPFEPGHHHPRMGMEEAHPLLLAPPDLSRLAMAILMIGVDLGAVAWTNDYKLRQRLLLLEKQNLKQELEQLRYQINPHFFMNTLNNIHALVDIDQDQAKSAIVKLSKLMRYSLYEANDTLAPLQHEVDFLQIYISLMKIRYSDKVQVSCEIQESLPAEAMIPPLMFMTFVENAFKHGISYMNPSYISIKIYVDKENGQIHFICENSRHILATASTDKHHGIGLQNVMKRLELQYAGKHSLIIDTHDESRFLIDLTLPITTI